MYNTHFGFIEAPFEINLDQRFLFLSDDHKEVLAALSYFIKERKGFAIICGDVGTGKTMLINTFLEQLPESVQPINIANPFINTAEILRYIAKTLHIQISDESVVELTETVRGALLEANRQGKNYVLIVDEAHLLSDQSLEEIRVLSNIETPERKLLQILLVGQYELSYQLDRPELRPLRQRININRFLSPLDLRETIDYIDHRLRKVGSSFNACFEANTRSLIYKMTQGVPRCINQLCDNALLICMTAGLRKVNRKILKQAQAALQTDRIFTPKSVPGKMASKLRKLTKPPVLLGAAAGIIVLIFFLTYAGLLGNRSLKITYDIHPGAPPTKIGSPPPARQDKQAFGTHKQESTDSQEKEAWSPIPLEAHPVTSKTIHEKGKEASEPGVVGAGPKKSSAATGPAEVKLAPPPGHSEGTDNPPAVALGSQAPAPPSQLDNIKATKGENLDRIAAQHYPGQRITGLEAIILANPTITDESLIYPDQIIYLPKLQGQIIQLRDKLFYGIYGRYQSSPSLEKDISWLIKRNIRFQVIDTKNSKGKTVHRVVIGGYEKAEDLERALKRAKNKID